MMKSLFGGGLLNSTEPPQDATHKAKPTTALPASAAAAIAAAAAASKADTTSGTPLDATTNDPKSLSVEWDFGDGDESFAEQARVAAAGLGDFDFASPVPQAAVAAAGEAWSGLGISAAAVESPPSPGAVTPKARHGSGGMWADGIAAAAAGGFREGCCCGGGGGGGGQGGTFSRVCRIYRGKMTKVGHLLGINDAAAAATLQKEMTVLTRKQDEEIIRRQKLGGLGSWKTSTKSAEVTESQELSNTAAADPQGNRRQSSSSTTSSCSQEQQQVVSDSVSGKGRRSRTSSSGCASPTSSAAAASGEGGGGAEEKRSRLSRLRRHRSDKVRSSSSSSSSSRRARGGSGVSTSSAPRSHAGSHDLAAWEEGGGARGAPAPAPAAVEALEGEAPVGEAVDESGGGKSGATSEPGRGPSSGRNLGHSNGERPSSGGRGDGARKGSPAAATEPRSSESASRPGPPADGGDNANKPDAEPDATAADGDGAAGGRRLQGGGGHEIEGEEGKEQAAGEEAGTRRLPLPAPLVTKRSWEHDDVGDLFESVDGNGNDGAVLVAAEGMGGVDQAAAAAAGGEAGEARNLGENGVGSKAGAVGGSQAASPSGVRPESAEAGDTARGEEGGVRGAGGHSSLPPTPPLGRALELDGRSEKDTPTSVPKSSLGMPWGSVVFRSSTSESPGANSMNSTAGVLGLGTSGELRDAEGGSVAVTDDYGGSGAEAQEEEGVRGWEEAGVGAAAAGRATLARVGSATEADDDLASKAATGEEEEEPLQPLPEGAPTGGSGSADDDDDSGVVVPLPKVDDGGVVVEEEEEEGATEAVEAAEAETADVADVAKMRSG
ncbi:unnamed protein product [Ectocarpus sp. 8 AP-2014]